MLTIRTGLYFLHTCGKVERIKHFCGGSDMESTADSSLGHSKHLSTLVKQQSCRYDEGVPWRRTLQALPNGACQ